uniref:Uncharacterized protein n=1 Tax=Odontella aurita TaxID=265563 RepID=A0A7S4J9Q3_9STRA|mmetsp:Transcript_42096/g.127694  ORF Transcript_42096/g.127694 Transcript_42096/m.127694 type:complete len:131 (+) Transcript_42096:104-496(+)
MACLDPPLTVIGGGSGDQDADLDADADHLFSPPAATWYDECHQHFVALLQKQKKRRSGDSISLSLSPTIGSAGSYDAPRGEVRTVLSSVKVRFNYLSMRLAHDGALDPLVFSCYQHCRRYSIARSLDQCS